jgi:hypothetical protein
MMKRALLICFLLFQSSLWAVTSFPGEITLVNDSPYILTASVFTNSGGYLGQVSLQPGQQKNFITNLGSTSLNRPGFPDVSITPYRIIFQCAGGEVYSMCQDGSVGAYVRASACQGQLQCAPKQQKKPEVPQSPPRK